MRNKINIIFTSAGRRVELLRSFKNAYNKLGLEGSIIATDIDPLAPTLQLADRSYIVPRSNSKDFILKLAEIIKNEQADLIFPLIDPDIPILAESRNILEAEGARVVVISKEATKTTADKWLTWKFFRNFGLPTPCSWKAEETRDLNFDYPVFIKPRFGSAGKKTFKVCNEKELSFFIEYVPKPIIQEYLPGPEITNDVICDFENQVLAVVSRKRIEVRWGEVAKGITIYNKKIVSSCLKIAKKLRAIGPVTVQCILKDGIPYFTEINARFGGGVPLGIAAGVDSPRWLIANAAGLDVEIPPVGNYQVGMRLTRFDDSFFLSENDIRKIKHTFFYKT